MPVKWTAEADQILLLKIIETSECNPNSQKIADAWPTNLGSPTPTPRAIAERLVRIRALAKSAGTVGASKISSANTTPTSTPRKKNSNISPSKGKSDRAKDELKKAGSVKRKHNSNDKTSSDSRDDDENDDDIIQPSKEVCSLDSETDEDFETPKKRIKKETPIKAESSVKEEFIEDNPFVTTPGDTSMDVFT